MVRNHIVSLLVFIDHPVKVHFHKNRNHRYEHKVIKPYLLTSLGLFCISHVNGDMIKVYCS